MVTAIGLVGSAVVLDGSVPTSWVTWPGAVGSAVAGIAALMLVRDVAEGSRDERGDETRRRIVEARASGAVACRLDEKNGGRAS